MEKIKKQEENILEKEKVFQKESEILQIACPYCNNKFNAEIYNSSELEKGYEKGASSKEIQCPKCKKVIVLDWSGEGPSNEDLSTQIGCGGGCQGSCPMLNLNN